ncbi:complex I assembly factor TIMMDC1, mitochondrial [Alligator mississippiensis]|uniref:Complex I assembly factor TIMMDC1, mitochondrial n=1 Tax=Alligator mississippiensis TaxID=8496 RepID=A0A151MDK9_ALLMI|nr:complex I assembly factor TIMMDC1, mitochondrial [Alligator mississippiensis]KYO22614.1 complex I assembly factor TIMMDC1, mitochondrial [Alligator mississippiensis]
MAAPWGSAEPPDSGWERLRQLWHRDEVGNISEDAMDIIKSAFSAMVVGFIYGGAPAFLQAKRQFVERAQGDVFYSRLDAVQSAQTAGLRGFIRYGWRWSWRITVFVTVFNTASTGLSLYYDKVSLSHYVAAGALTGSLFRMHLGLRGLAVGGIFGALLCIPAGGLLIAVQKLCPETMVERRKRKQRELYEQKTAEWGARLNSIEIALEEMERDNKKGGMEEDTKRIQELLNLPKNSLPSEDRN